MKIAVLSGKGGTGKTFVSVNLAYAAENAVYIDCDVEEPNGHLFLKPESIKTEKVQVTAPTIDMEKCTGCKVCVDFCKFHALAYAGGKLLHFKEVCHSCSGCMLLCPKDAIICSKREIGMIQEGVSGNVSVITGILNTGEVSGVPIIKTLLRKIPDRGCIIIDCPPGSACSAMESVKHADYCILVTEPTIFGVHNLSMVYELVRLFHKKVGVIINKCMPGENLAKEYCIEKGIKVLAEIPYSRETGMLVSNGEIAVLKSMEIKELFETMLMDIEREAQNETAAATER